LAEKSDLATDKPTEAQPPHKLAALKLDLDAPSLASSVTEIVEVETSKKPFVSKGEQVHKWGSYLGVDWLFNTATGVSFAYWGKYTDLGKKLWSKPVTDAFETALKPLIKHPEQLKKSAGYGTMFMSIIAGGMFTIPPLMVLEDNHNKKKITRFFDNIIYGKKTVDEDPKFAAAYDEIEHAPKKDFTSGLTSRFTALAPMLAMVLIPTTKKISNKLWFNHVEHASEAVAAKAGLTAEKLFAKTTPADAKERWKFVHESVAMDFGLGVPYAVLHSIFYNKFAASKEDKENDAKALADSTNGQSPLPAATAPEPENAKKWAADAPRKSKPATPQRAQKFTERMADKSDLERQMI
jgi:hypothetical protein